MNVYAILKALGGRMVWNSKGKRELSSLEFPKVTGEEEFR